MKKNVISLIVLMLLLPLSVWADGYSVLWKQYEDAMKKDLPKTQIACLAQIVKQAERQKDYGHLLKAQLLTVSAQTQIAPDSLPVMMKRLEDYARHAEKTNKVQAAVYYTLLGKYYEGGARDSVRQQKAAAYLAKAMAHPELLAAQKTQAWKPATVEGVDSKLFYDDMLHVIGMEVDDYKTLHHYYLQTDNRVAACYTGLQLIKKGRCEGDNELCKSKYIQQLDSLINRYQDLRIAGEIAIERYYFMASARDVKVEDKIAYINYALDKWGDWKRMNALRNAYQELTLPQFRVEMKDITLTPHQKAKVELKDIRNVSSLTLRVWKTSYTGEVNENLSNAKRYELVKKSAVLQEKLTRVKTFVGLPDYRIVSDSMELPSLSQGVYLVDVVSDNKDVPTFRTFVFVSDLKAVYTSLPNHRHRIAVLNATTGLPVPDAKVKLTYEYYSNKPDEVLTLTCNKEGEVVHGRADDRPRYIYVYTDADKSGKKEYFYEGGYFYESDNEGKHLCLMTDRSIYRPGQTVYVAGIAYLQNNGDKFQATARQVVTLTLRDTNNQKVERKQVTTDEYGKLSTEFTLPTSGLSGYYFIDSEGDYDGEVEFRVEEYKRPTFTVDFPRVNERYAAGDTLMVKATAKSYAGVPVQGAKVKYKVVRNRSMWWRWWGSDERTTTVKTADATTDNEGNFIVEIPLDMGTQSDESSPRYYNFVVEADVTDQSGETRHGSMSIPLGTKATAFGIEMPSRIEKKSQPGILFDYRNMAGDKLEAEVRYYVDGSDKPVIVPSNEKVALGLQQMQSGKHRIMAVCERDTAYHDFVLFGLNDKKVPYDTPSWFYLSDTQFSQDNSPVYLQIGGNYAPQHVLYNVVSGERVLESGVMTLNNEVQTREWRYKPEYGDGITLTYAWVKDGEVYTHVGTLMKPMPNKSLTMKWTTFRNKLEPGQKEEWTLQVLQPDGQPAVAQLLAVLYDKSLDALRKHQWRFSTDIDRELPNMRWLHTAGWSGHSDFMAMRLRPLSLSNLDFSSLDKSMFTYHPNDYYDLQARYAETVMIRGTGSVKKKALGNSVAAPLVLKQTVALSADVVTQERAGDAADTNSTASESSEENTSSVRENLNETAFFYPALQTDAQGNVKLKFTLPESLTTWRFMGLAHDKNVNHGMLIDEVVAKKSVMVQPNMPRFMRLGDKGMIVAKIFNTTEEVMEGRAVLELINPETQSVVERFTQDYRLAANGTGTASFDVDLQKGSSLYANGATVLVAKVMVEGRGHADGEQHYLPILSNREWVTNTLAFTQHEAGVKTIDLEQLFAPQGDKKRLTVEYTNNPAWLMIQALPYVGEVNEDNSISLAAAYYANSIARYILKKVPHAKQMIEQWKRESGEETSMMSGLQKNQELKSLVLNETPWVAEAKDEAEQKQALIRYFDENSLNYRLKTCAEKLSKLQQSDGSWSWYPGMRGSIYMTTTVANLLARLQTLIGEQAEVGDMHKKAFRFMNQWVKEEVKEMKRIEVKTKKQVRPSEQAVDYLYLSALSQPSLSKSVEQDKKFLVDRLVHRSREMTIYGKSIAAVVLTMNQRRDVAKDFLQSMKEYSVYQPEMGRYYDTRKAYYSWFDYRIPVQTYAIEALQMLQPNDKQTIEEMQRWLLMSKRTQQWDTPINSVNAIYAFLKGRMELLDTSGQTSVKFSIDGKALDLPQATAGTGYVKVAMDAEKMKTLTVDKSTNQTSWGAVYGQMMQPTKDIKATSSGLKVTRELVNAGELKVGSKVKIRITIEADRDYDYVQVVDKRAACMESVNQLSGYRYGCYITPRDHATHYYLDRLPKGKRVIETEYYIDRQGTFSTGTCVVQCAYSPEYAGRAEAMVMHVK